ncbi:Fc.00g099950.m01.CDS01 [Cosmosporella sp. VM-42]
MFLNLESRKLMTADNEPVDLALMFTYRLIAEEMKGIALRVKHYQLLDYIFGDQRNHSMSPPLFYERSARLWTEFMALKYPRFVPCLNRILEEGISNSLYWILSENWGEPPPLHRQAMAYTARQLVSTHGMRFVKEANEMFRYDDPQQYDILEKLGLSPKPWEILSKKQVGRMGTILGSPFWPAEIGSEFWAEDVGEKFPFSTAAAPIQFLDSIPARTRIQIRNVLIHEDRLAAASPQCHAQGLLPFCQENTLLCIERRVGSWRNIFQAQ